MADCSSGITFFFLTIVFLSHPSSADVPSLYFLYTSITTGYTDFPDFSALGLLNGKQFMAYNSSKKLLIPKDWIKTIVKEDFWNGETQELRNEQDTFNNILKEVMKKLNHSEGLHTLQRMYGCELDDNNTSRAFDQYGYDGEDFIRLDFKTGSWTAVKPQANSMKLKWEQNEHVHWRNFRQHVCVDQLKKFVSYCKETLDRKVHPKTALFQEEPSSKLVCHATGFFPKTVTMTWRMNNEELHEHADQRETLPNQDGTFQKRSILTIPAEDLQKHNYTCVIQHSSLGEELVLPVSERRILRGGGSGAQSEQSSIGIISCVIVGLLVLVAVIAGIIWKKTSSACDRLSSSNSGNVCHPNERRERDEQIQMELRTE